MGSLVAGAPYISQHWCKFCESTGGICTRCDGKSDSSESGRKLCFISSSEYSWADMVRQQILTSRLGLSCMCMNLLMYMYAIIPVMFVVIWTLYQMCLLKCFGDGITTVWPCLKSWMTYVMSSGGFEGARGGTAPLVKSLAPSVAHPVILYSTTYNVGQRYWTTMK